MGHGGNFSERVALVAAEVVVDMVAVGMAIPDLVMMEATLEVAGAITILSISIINLQILDHDRRKFWRQKCWPLWRWRPVPCETQNQGGSVVPGAAVSMAVGRWF